MKRVNEISKRAIAFLMSFLLVFSLVPTVAMPAFAAEEDTRVVDPSTINNWQRYFGESIENTANAGGIWTDKSVFKDETLLSPVSMNNDEDNFLVALSAIVANKEIKGYSHIPTDTMLVLDVSGSMNADGYTYNNDKKYTSERIDAMVESTNKAIQTLLDLNKNNRVGVVLYSGSSSTGSSSTNTATVILPLDRYTTSKTAGSGSEKYNVYLQRDGENSGMKVGIATTTNKNNKVVCVTNSSGKKVTDSNKTVVGGTYIQNGIYKAWKEFENVKDVTVEDGFQVGQKRMPIMVLMSDGAPTTATTDYTNIGTSKVGNGENKCATNGTAFLTQLTASWARIKMEAKYGTTPKVYTLGLGIDDLQIGKDQAKSVLNPDSSTSKIKEYWSNYAKFNSVTITAHNTSGQSTTFSVNSNSTIKDAITKANNSNGKIKQPQYYVDQYFAASDAAALISAFDSIVNQIILQSKYYPTEAEFGKHDLGGYIEFEDAIGEFMEVKDMKGILLGDTLYNGHAFAELVANGKLGTTTKPTDIGNEFVWSIMDRLGITDVQEARDLIRQAYLSGQISYESDDKYSNYVAWYADANGAYLGFASETNVPKNAKYIVKSYGYLGYGDITSEESIKGSDLMYMTVRVQEEIETGRQTVSWSIPASLIPTVTYEIELEGDSYENAKNITMERKAANPVRLVYEVGLIDGINELTVADFMKDQEHVHKDADGNYVFYTNKWGDADADGSTDIDYDNPYSHIVTLANFEPSAENERYYYTEDATVYARDKDNNYVPVTYDPNQRDGDYYRAIKVFSYTDKASKEAKIETIYEKIHDITLKKATKDSDGDYYYIPAGTVARLYEVNSNNEANVMKKTSNNTGTLDYATYATIYNPTPTTNEGYCANTFLGNNGKFTITPATGIKLTKTIDTVEPGTKTDGFQFTIQLTGRDLASSYPYEIFDADGKSVGTGNYRVTDGKIVATLSAGQTVYITGLPAGASYSIVESEHEDYVVDKINGKDAYGGEAATGTIVDKALAEVSFENTLKTNGNLVINKVVTHPFGDDYQMPEKEFNVTVKLDGKDAGVNVNNIEVEIVKTGETEPSKIKTSNTGELNFKIKHGETVSLHEIPAGVKYSVVESNNPDGFTLDTEHSSDLVGTISTDVNSSETLVNKYTPGNVYPINLTLTGEKNLEGRTWLDGDEFTFALEKFDGTSWVQLATKTVTKGNPTFDFTGTLQNEKYTNVGTYQYRVRELGSDSNGITYDKTIRYFDVTVTDVDMDGKLEIQPPKKVGNDTVYFVTGTTPTEVTYKNGNYNIVTDFNNKYAANTDTYIDLNITKTITNNTNVDIPLNGFYFALYKADGKTAVMHSDETNALGNTYIRVVYDADDFAKENGDEESIVKDEKGNIVEKTYKYVLKENIPEKADQIPGMTYNDKTYEVTVVVKDNLDGKLSATVSVDGAAVDTETPNTADVTHNNTYVLKETKVSLDVNKHLDGAKLKADEFTFQLYNADANWSIVGDPIQTVKNAADGKVAFADLTYTAVGTYNYILREVVPSGVTSDGITYDTTAYKVTFVVEQKVVDGVATDELVATKTIINAKTGETVSSVTFANSHADTDGASVTLNGTKTLTGRNLITSEFNFALYKAKLDGSSVKVDGKLLQIVSNTATGKFIFSPLTFDEEGTSYYIIREINGGQTLYGVEYDDTDIVVRVDVTKNEDTRKLEASVTVIDAPNNEIAFENTYTAKNAEVQLTATKTLQGRDMTAGEFTFQLLNADTETAIDTVTNKAAANGEASNITFKKLTFDKPGTYNYVIKEVKGDLGGVTYDEAERNVVITVKDNGKGKLVAETKIDGVSVTNTNFVNTYNTDDATTVISGSKTLIGREMKEGEFWFELRDSNNKVLQYKANTAEGTFAFDAITYDKVGTYTYTVTERNSKQAGVTYDDAEYTVVVKVTDNGKGNLVATQSITKNTTSVNSISFTNYDPVDAEAVIKGTKSLSGRNMAEGEFTFQLFEAGKDKALYTVKNAADGKFQFPKMTYDKAGTYTYEVKEVLPVDKDGKPTTVVTEKGMTYDDTVYTVSVTVAEDGSGKLVAKYEVGNAVVTEANLEKTIKFENKYNPNATTAIIDTVSKALTGRDLARGEFEFKLTLDKVNGKAPETQTKPLMAKNGMVWNGSSYEAAGTVYQLKFNLNYDKAGTYEYTMEEVVPEDAVNNSKDGVTYDTAKFKVVIKVTDNGEGQLVAGKPEVTKLDNSGDTTFNNTYTAKPVKVTLQGTKSLSGKTLEKGQFGFELYDKEGKVVASAKNGNVSAGSVKDFEMSMTYNKVGEYKYTLKEVNGGQKLDGIAYDDTTYEVVVKVTDDGKGQLVAETTIDGSKSKDIEFTNKYSVAPITEAIAKVTKTLTGRDMAADEFSFVIKDEAGNVIQTKKNAESTDGKAADVVFDKIEYTKAGVYKYTIEEVKGNLGGITYDGAKFDVTVTVVDNGDGTLTATPVVKLAGTKVDGANFNNSYETEALEVPVSTLVTVEKTLSGRDIKAGEFQFQVIDKDGSVVSTGKNKALEDGETVAAVEFDKKLVFEEEGTYTFTIKEVDTKLAGVDYDETVYTLKVTIEDDGEGHLVVVEEEVTLLNGNDSAETATFNNTYTPNPIKVDLVKDATKVLKGRELKAGEFQFELYEEVDKEFKLLQTKSNEAADKDGIAEIIFDEVEFTTAGTYKFKVVEKNNGLEAIDYSEAVYEYTVTIKDDGKANLTVESIECTLDGEEATPTFENVYRYTDVEVVKSQAVNDGKATTQVVKAKKGDTITYFLTVTNKGTVPAYSMEITDKVPAGLEVIDGSITKGGVLSDDGTIKWTVDELAGADESGEFGEYVVSFKVKVPEVKEATTWKNVASATYTDPSKDPEDPGNPDNPDTPDDPNKKEVTSNEVEFNVEKPAEIPPAPSTGDSNNMAMWTAIMALAGTGFVGLKFKKKED